MASLAERFLRHLDSAAFFPREQPVLVALSGGLDSVVLLHLLRFRRGQALAAAHFDHALRPESEADAAWVRGLCRAWGVPLVTARAAVPPRGEAAARAARYAFLHGAAAGAGAARIATAHHRDDQLETVLFRIARGTGVRGLAGIPAARGDVVRPLLPFSRRELLAYARACRIRWREDPSNRDPAYARNRIRHRLLPRLEAAGLDRPLLRLAELAGGIERAWRRELPELLRAADLQRREDGFALARGALQAYHPASRARVVRYLLGRLGIVPTRRAARLAAAFMTAGVSGTGIELGRGARIERELDRILLRREAGPGTGTADRPLRIEAPGSGSGCAEVGGVRYLVSWGPADGPPRLERRAVLDAAELAFPLEVRGWRPGDRIFLGYGTKKLKKLFAEKRVGVARRARVPVVAEQQPPGRVLWVKDVAFAKTAPGTWQITVEHDESG